MEIVELFFMLLIAVALLAWSIGLLASVFIGSPFVPTPYTIVDQLLTLTRVGKGDIVYDLGSGDGRILISAAKKGAMAIGWEINPILVVWTIISSLFAGVKGYVKVNVSDYRGAPLYDATVIVVYSLPERLYEIEKMIRKQCKRGTRIISYRFPLQTFTPKQQKNGIYLYRL